MRSLSGLLMVCLLALLPGCAAFRPMDGVPARYLPEELRGHSRENGQMVDLSLLRRTEPAEYLIDSGDVLAVYIENILGQRDQPPINTPLDDSRPLTLGYPLTVRDDGTLSLPLIPPLVARGKTIPQFEQEVRYAYTIGRRLLRPGQDRIVISLQRPKQHRILVVRQELQSDVLTGINTANGTLGNTKKGTGQVVSLDNYKNDVLNALVKSGGLPGLDAQNVVYVLRARRAAPLPQQAQTVPLPMYGPPGGPYGVPDYSSSNFTPLPAPGPYGGTLPGGIPASGYQVPNYSAPGNSMPGYPAPGYPAPGYSVPGPVAMPPYGPSGVDPQTQYPPLGASGPSPANDLTRQFGPMRGQSPDRPIQQVPPLWNNVDQIASGAFNNGPNAVRIPLRLADGEPLQINERDVILYDGDIIFIASRDDEVFYTGGLLGGGEYTLPRDRDIDVLEAIAIAESSSRTQQSGRTALNGDVSISPSEAIILRRLPNHSQVPILVNLYRARKYPSERLRIQPGDYIVLQYTKTEAVGAFIERHILESALFGVAASQFNAN